MSTQDTRYQTEIAERVHLPYALVSDEKLEFVEAMKLPVLEWKGRKLVRRLTLAVQEGKVVKVWYPVFPPDQSANQVVEWLEGEGKGGAR